MLYNKQVLEFQETNYYEGDPMKNSLSSLVLIQQYYSEGKDIFQAFVPLVLYILDKQGQNHITFEEIQDLFRSEYGINIPRYPLTTILNRLKPDYLTQKKGKIFIDRVKVSSDAPAGRLTEERKNLSLMLNDFVKFCQEFVQPVEVTIQEADLLFSDFLESHDPQLLFALNDGNGASLLDKEENITDPDKIYLLNRYINNQLTKNLSYANFIVHAALGHLYASTILYRDFLNVRGSAVCKSCYLDTGILFDLSGINGEFRKRTSREFIKELIDLGTTIKIFEHNYHEFLSILEGCVSYIQSPDFKFTKASRALLFFHENGYSKDLVQVFISLIPQDLKTLGIDIVNTPNPNRNLEYQIDRGALKERILEVYENNHNYSRDEWGESQTIETDIDSIEYIYKLRGSSIPINIGEVTDVLLTTNSGLARASMLFQKSLKGYDFFSIPPVITDVFLGTMIWIQAPSKLTEDYNKCKMLTYTNAVIRPSDNLIDKLSLQVTYAMENKKQPLTPEQAKVLLETALARQVLSDSTLNDDQRINAETPYDMLHAMEKEFTSELLGQKEELENQLRHEQEEREEAEKNYSETGDKLSSLRTNVETKVSVFAKRIRRAITWVLFFILLLFVYLLETDVIPPILSRLIERIFLVTGFGGILTFISIGKKVEAAIAKKLKSILMKE